MVARALPGGRRGARPRRRSADRDDAERHRQGVPVPRHLRVPARAVPAADHRHGGLHRHRAAEVEPDEHLQLPPAGGRGDAGAGDRLRAQHRRRRAGLGARLGPGAGRALRRGGRPHLLLRQRRGPVRRGDVQDARLRPAVGHPHPGALRRAGPQAAPLPLRRAGQLPGPDRGAAGEQRAADRAGDARGHAVQGRPGPRGPAAGVERGTGPAPAVGPAVVAAAAAGAGLRDRPAGVRRPVHRVGRRGGQGRRARRGRAGRDRPGGGDGRRGRGRRVGLHEGPAGRLAGAATPSDGVRGRRRGRGQPVHLDRAQPAHRRPGHRRSRPSTPPWRPRRRRRSWRLEGRSGRRAGGRGAGRAAHRRRARRRT